MKGLKVNALDMYGIYVCMLSGKTMQVMEIKRDSSSEGDRAICVYFNDVTGLFEKTTIPDFRFGKAISKDLNKQVVPFDRAYGNY